jgi:hypothetical protein
MHDSNERLRSAIFAEIERLERAQDPESPNLQDMRLGAFVDATLNRTGSNRAKLAHTLRMDGELLDAILDGVLAGDQVGDAVLTNIAQALNYEPNLLRLLMGRSITPARDARQSK